MSDRRLYRIALGVGLLIGVALLLAQGLVRFDPYRLAQRPMAWALDRNPGLPERLALYGREATAWQEAFRPGVRLAEGLVSLVDQAETFGWWETLLNWIDRIPGALEFLQSMDILARDLIALDAALNDLAEAAWIAEPLEAMHRREWLDRRTARRVDGGAADVLVVLVEVHERLDQVSQRIRRVDQLARTADLLMKLDEARRANPLLPKRLVDWITEAVEAWRGLAEDFDRVSDQIRTDRETLERIRLWYARAEAVDRAITTSVVWELAVWIDEQAAWFLGVLGLSLAVSAAGMAVHQREERREL